MYVLESRKDKSSFGFLFRLGMVSAFGVVHRLHVQNRPQVRKEIVRRLDKHQIFQPTGVSLHPGAERDADFCQLRFASRPAALVTLPIS